jgi:hypothetical protein
MTGIGVIVLAGSVCGVLDLISASALFRLKGGTFERLLQFIASGAFGESAFKGGKEARGWASCFISLSPLRQRLFTTRQAAV